MCGQDVATSKYSESQLRDDVIENEPFISIIWVRGVVGVVDVFRLSFPIQNSLISVPPLLPLIKSFLCNFSLKFARTHQNALLQTNSDK